jgi:beta-1,4-N-acetylglucosaminyltransferase
LFFLLLLSTLQAMAAAPTTGKSVFVTVGTTLFDALIAAVNDDAVLLRLAHLGYTTVLMQTGRILISTVDTACHQPLLTSLRFATFAFTGKGSFEPQQGQRNGGIVVASYRFKPTLAADMAAANLVISHAGAGSIMVCSKEISTCKRCYLDAFSASLSWVVCDTKSAMSWWLSCSLANAPQEALRLGKPLITVVNAALMDNHQSEIADAMAQRGYALATTPDQLLAVLQQDSIQQLKQYPAPADPRAFVTALNLEMASWAVIASAAAEVSSSCWFFQILLHDSAHERVLSMSAHKQNVQQVAPAGRCRLLHRTAVSMQAMRDQQRVQQSATGMQLLSAPVVHWSTSN